MPDTQTKNLGSDLSTRDQVRADRLARSLPHSGRRRGSRRRLRMLRESLLASLQKTMRRVVQGQVTAEEAATSARSAMIVHFGQAYQEGFAVAGLPSWEMTDDQVDSIALIVEAEVAFFRDFMVTLESHVVGGIGSGAAEAMDPNRRLGLYAGAVDDMLWRGWYSVLPSSVTIEWRLNVAEHCPDCLALAAGGPYTKPGGENPLPTVPRNGDTRCLGNCRCFIETTGAFESTLAPLIGAEVTEIAGSSVDPMSPGALSAAIAYTELAERHAWHRRMHLLEPAAGHDRVARELAATLDELAAASGHRVRMTATGLEIVDPVLTAKAHGMRFVPPASVSDDLVLAVATVIALNWTDRGEITAVESSPPRVTLDDDAERSYRLDAVGRGILFVEDTQ